MDGQAPSLPGWLLRIERGHPTEIELGLERVGEVARRMGLGAPRARVITVGGTNGKGSCVAVMEQLLLAAGKRVGSYTSPHLRRYNERVRLQGVAVDDALLCAAFAAIEQARGEISLSYFEFGTLAALEIFRHAAPDILLLEVGLGGRLDAVNLVDADIALISSIQIDHVEWLGNDRDTIAVEKAGIFRAGRPVVCADPDPPPALRRAALALAAPWFGVRQEFAAPADHEPGWSWRGRDAAGGELRLSGLEAPRLLDANIAAALQALALCGELPDRELIARVLPTISLPGRFEKRVTRGIECVLDVAHNPAAIELLRDRLLREPAPGRTAIVFGAMRDKDLPAMLGTLAGCATWWLLPGLAEPRAAAAGVLAQFLAALGIGHGVQCTADVDTAMNRAFAVLRPGDRLLVCGSFHTVGPALEWLDRHDMQSGD